MNRKTLVLSALLALVVATSSYAQVFGGGAYGRWSGLTTSTVGGSGAGGTNAIVANTTNTYAVRLDCPQTDNVVLQAQFKLTGAGTSAVEFQLVPGTEVGYSTNNTGSPIHKFNIVANGTTGVAGVTNVAVTGYPALWVISQGHNNANAVTNLSFSYGFKR